jgi:CheY-like chemotaxis protein
MSSRIVLMVEDDPEIAALADRYLARMGCTVHRVESGALAVSWLKKRTADLLLLDFALPDMSGPALLDELQLAGLKIPFMVITGQGCEQTAVDCLRRGALDYLTKDDRFWEALQLSVARAFDRLESDMALTSHEISRDYLCGRLLALAPFGVALVDRDGRVVTANPVAAELGLQVGVDLTHLKGLDGELLLATLRASLDSQARQRAAISIGDEAYTLYATPFDPARAVLNLAPAA